MNEYLFKSDSDDEYKSDNFYNKSERNDNIYIYNYYSPENADTKFNKKNMMIPYVENEKQQSNKKIIEIEIEEKKDDKKKDDKKFIFYEDMQSTSHLDIKSENKKKDDKKFIFYGDIKSTSHLDIKSENKKKMKKMR